MGNGKKEANNTHMSANEDEALLVSLVRNAAKDLALICCTPRLQHLSFLAKVSVQRSALPAWRAIPQQWSRVTANRHPRIMMQEPETAASGET